MYSSNPNCGFPFYLSREQQTFRKEYAHGEGLTGIMCTTARVPTFQLQLSDIFVDIDIYELYDENDVKQEVIDKNLLEFRCTENNGSFLYSDGSTGNFLTCGQYRYIKIRVNSVDYYSELFRVEIA